MKPFVKGDIDGFFSLGIDNLIQLLLLVSLLHGVLEFPSELIYGRILPGVAVSFLVGNLFYAWQALKLARKTGRDDVCALPYGINTVSLIAFVFLVMLPTKQIAIAQGLENPDTVAWQAGLVACFSTGVIEFLCAFAAKWLRSVTPRAAMLATISGTGLAFLALGFIYQLYALPIVGLPTLALVLLVVFGRIRFFKGVPGMLVVIVVGTALGWLTGAAPTGSNPFAEAGFFLPLPVISDLVAGLSGNNILPFLSIILPMGLLSGLASLQNIESASAAGDSYPERSSLIVNGIGTVAASLFGSAFPTSIYIGHPGWKSMGARAGYSTLNGIFVTIICLTGTISLVAWAIPIEAGLAIFIWIGMVLAAQAFEVTPRRHYIAVVLGMIPGIIAWSVTLLKSSLRATGHGTVEGFTFSPEHISLLRSANVFIEGGFALEQGFLYTAMILSAITVYIIDRKFIRAASWSLAAALLCLIGLMHAYQYTGSDTVVHLPLLDAFSFGLAATPQSWRELFPAWPWAGGYAISAAIFLAVNYLASQRNPHHSES